jgi:hypothetical protein
MTWEKKKVLITVKAYPECSQKHGDIVCTAGITEDGDWIRLYPLSFDLFKSQRKIQKCFWIEILCQKSTSDSRKESYRVKENSMRIVDESLSKPKADWKLRNEYILPHLDKSVEELEEMAKIDKISLGLVKPKEVLDFYMKRDLTEEEKKKVEFAQMTLFGNLKTPLQKIPHVFKYKFICNDIRCDTHDMTCEDWELFESYRSWDYKDEELIEKLREKYFIQMTEERELYFYLGTHFRWQTWMIIGIYYPPKNV